MYTFSALNKETLQHLYGYLGLTAREIGQTANLTESSILLKLKKFGVPSNFRGAEKRKEPVEFLGKKTRKNELTDDLLRGLYGRGNTDKEIGGMFGMTGEGVSYRRKKIGVLTRSASEGRKALNHKRGLKDISELSTDELRQELIVYRGIKGVVRKYSSTFGFVKELLHSRGLDRDKVLLDTHELSDVQRKLIIGGLLGDGGAYDGGVKGYYYKEGHCLEQLEYVKWKVELFGDLVKKDLYHETKISNLGLKSYLVTFSTIKCAEIMYYRDLFYKFIDGKFVKTIPEKCLNEMDAFTFSVWFFDDGGLSDKKLPYICSGAPYSDIVRASKALNDLFDLESYVEPSGGIFSIYFKNLAAFFNLVNPYVQPCFYYKIPPKQRFMLQGITPRTASLSKLIPTYSPHTWKDLPVLDQKVWIENVVKYYSFKGFPYYHLKSQEQVSKIIRRLQDTDICADVLNTGVFNKVAVTGTDLASSYFPHMWSAEIRGKRSVYNNYVDSKRFSKVVRNVFKYRNILSDASIRSELRHGSTVQNFKPLIAKTIYDLYCPVGGKVFDYSSGYGGRLLGSMVSSKVQSYVGTDPCQQTFLGLRKLARRLGKYYSNKEVKLFPNCSEDSSWYSAVDPVDVCFSSPPYFNAEKYSKEDTQSYVRYPEITQWLDKFLGGVIENCCGILKEGGYFIINIADTGGHQLQREAYERLVQKFSFVRSFVIQFPSYFSGDKFEPILVFRKDGVGGPSYEEISSTFSVEKEASVPLKRLRNNSSPVESFDKRGAIKSLQDLARKGVTLSRSSISGVPFKDFPFSVSSVEKEFKGWNIFIRESGLNPVYTSGTPLDHVQPYLKVCLDKGKCLSFYSYEKTTGNPSSRLKRLFNKGKPFHHLAENLKLVALNPHDWDLFLENFK